MSRRALENPKDQVMAFKATMAERRIIEAQAKKQGVLPSMYIRSAVLMSLVMDGNREAILLVADELREVAVDRMRSWVGVDVRKLQQM